MNMLSQEQIETLFKFCEKHCVRYYDVQVELVDHLATAIENKINQHSDISFEEALKEEYKSFGVLGFGKYISEKGKQIERKLLKDKYKILLSFFTPPKLILSLGTLIFLLYPFIVNNAKSIQIFTIVFGGLVFATVIIAIIFFLVSNKKYKPKRNLYLLKASNPLYYIGAYPIGLNSYGQMINYSLKHNNATINYWISLFLLL